VPAYRAGVVAFEDMRRVDMFTSRAGSSKSGVQSRNGDGHECGRSHPGHLTDLSKMTLMNF
jgi:hypothetical protein